MSLYSSFYVPLKCGLCSISSRLKTGHGYFMMSSGLSFSSNSEMAEQSLEKQKAKKERDRKNRGLPPLKENHISSKLKIN